MPGSRALTAAFTSGGSLLIVSARSTFLRRASTVLPLMDRFDRTRVMTPIGRPRLFPTFCRENNLSVSSTTSASFSAFSRGVNLSEWSKFSRWCQMRAGVLPPLKNAASISFQPSSFAAAKRSSPATSSICPPTFRTVTGVFIPIVAMDSALAATSAGLSLRGFSTTMLAILIRRTFIAGRAARSVTLLCLIRCCLALFLRASKAARAGFFFRPRPDRFVFRIGSSSICRHLIPPTAAPACAIGAILRRVPFRPETATTDLRLSLETLGRCLACSAGVDPLCRCYW